MTKQIDKDIFYRSLFDQSPDVTLYLDSESVIAKGNENLSNLLGVSMESISASPFINYLAKQERENFRHHFSEVLKGNPRSLNSLVLDKSGESIPVHMKLIPAVIDGNVSGAFGIIKDKSEARKIEDNLLEAELKFRAIVEDALVGVYIIKNRKLLYGNPYFHQLLGTENTASEFNITNFVHPNDTERIQADFESIEEGEEGKTQYTQIISTDGTVKSIEAHMKIIVINDESFVMGTIIDITEREKSWKKINFLSYYDQLTELPNRKSFEETINKKLIIAKALNQNLAILNLDLDRFKYINDSLGYRIGDELLIAVAKRFKQNLKGNQELFRVSGDEFVIIFPDSKNIDKVIELAKEILRSMDEQFVIHNHSFYMTTSIGVSIYPSGGEDAVSLIKNANAALHTAKADGKNTYKIYSSTMDINTFRTFKLGTDIRRAIEENQFEYYFQPKVSTVDNKIIGAEALIRWNHPEWGILSPNEFLPIIEEQRLEAEVDNKAFWMVARQIKAWQKQGLPQIPISVNVSANRLLDQNLASNFQEILKETKLDSELIEIEITETSMLENEKNVLQTFEDLLRTGVTISLDDFGTGFSSLSYLTKFSKFINTLKIDRSFITDLSTNEDSEANLITQTMIKLSDGLKMNVVAEGVETNKQYEILKQMGCKIIQGFLFSKPVPALEFEALLKQGKINVPTIDFAEDLSFEEQRKIFRVPLHFPLSGSMTLTRINGRAIDVGKSVVLIENIGLSGLRLLTDLKLTINPNIILELETHLFGKPIQLLGSIVWEKEKKPGIYQYDLEYAMDDAERAELTPILNKLAMELQKAPLVQDCSFVTEDRYAFIKKYTIKE